MYEEETKNSEDFYPVPVSSVCVCPCSRLRFVVCVCVCVFTVSICTVYMFSSEIMCLFKINVFL